MSKAPNFAFSSKTSAALDWWTALQQSDVTYLKAVSRIRDLYPDRQVWEYSDVRGRRIAALGGSKPDDRWTSTRDGWRPKKGRQGDAELQALWNACSTRYAPVPGMPSEVWGDFNSRTGGMTIHHPGFRLIGNELWCLWAADPPADAVDLAVWRRRKLSAYHLAREESESHGSDEVTP